MMNQIAINESLSSIIRAYSIDSRDELNSMIEYDDDDANAFANAFNSFIDAFKLTDDQIMIALQNHFNDE